MNRTDENAEAGPANRYELPRYDDLRPPRGAGGAPGPVGAGRLGGPAEPPDGRQRPGLHRPGEEGCGVLLDAALDAVDPPLDIDRGAPRHRLLHRPGPGLEDLDDVYDNFYPQVSSQWDSLAHVAYSPGVFYNGATDEDAPSGARNTIDHWA